MNASKPTFTVITTPIAASGLILKARELSAEHGGNFRAPHHTVGRAAIAGEVALAAGGVLLIDEPAEFSRSVIGMIEHLWIGMVPACRPKIVLTLRASTDDKQTAAALRRVADVFDGWNVEDHRVA